MIKKLSLVIALTAACFAANAWAAFYVNVINQAKSGTLFTIGEERVYIANNGVSVFPEKTDPTTIIFYPAGPHGKASLMIGSQDGSAYCKLHMLSTDDSVMSNTVGIQSSQTLGCIINHINDNTINLIILPS